MKKNKTNNVQANGDSIDVAISKVLNVENINKIYLELRGKYFKTDPHTLGLSKERQ